MVMRGGVGGGAMVLDPIILPLSHLCFAPLGQGSRKFETDDGNYNFTYKHVEVITICAIKD